MGKENHIVETTEKINTPDSVGFATDMNVATNKREIIEQQLFVLKEVMRTYSGKTIDNIVVQMEAGLAEMKEGGAE